MEILRIKKKAIEARRGQEEARKRPGRGQEETRKRPEEARKRPEKARKRPGRRKGQRVNTIRNKTPERQESRIWRKTARNATFYEQKMTSLGAPEFLEILENPRKGQKEARTGQGEARRGQEEARRGQERPGRAQEEAGPEWARRGQEEARIGPKRPGIQNLAKNSSKSNVL